MKNKTDLQKLKKVYDELGIKYHEITENGHTFIQKLKAHETYGYLEVNFQSVKIKSASQLQDFIEFDNKGKIASW